MIGPGINGSPIAGGGTPADFSAALARLDACLLSDTLDALGLTGQVDGLRPLWEGARLAGRAVTTRLVPVGQEQSKVAPTPRAHLGVSAIELAQRGEVIVVDNGGRTEMGAWGGLLSLAATLRGVAGVVVDGACRDVDEARQLGFPVFGRTGAVRTARGRVLEVDVGGPVTLGATAIDTGDYIVADASGVVTIRAHDMERVLSAALGLKTREDDMTRRLRDGAALRSVLSGDYESMLDDAGSKSARGRE
jgi:4-hydroxy-4-methyl-2-oxoglutarate aldolase